MALLAKRSATSEVAAKALALVFPEAKGFEPCLVSTSKGAMAWVDHVPPQGLTASISSKVISDALILDKIRARSKHAQWGNLLPYTAGGLKAALGYLEEYDVGPVDVIGPLAASIPFPLESLDQTSLTLDREAWVPENTLVLVPKTREFLGIEMAVTPDTTAWVVFNPSRALCILTPDF